MPVREKRKQKLRGREASHARNNKIPGVSVSCSRRPGIPTLTAFFDEGQGVQCSGETTVMKWKKTSYTLPACCSEMGVGGQGDDRRHYCSPAATAESDLCTREETRKRKQGAQGHPKHREKTKKPRKNERPKEEKRKRQRRQHDKNEDKKPQRYKNIRKDLFSCKGRMRNDKQMGGEYDINGEYVSPFLLP